MMTDQNTGRPAVLDGTLAGFRTWEDWSEVSDDWPANAGAEQTQQRIDETESEQP